VTPLTQIVDYQAVAHPRVTIWLLGEAQTSGGLWTLYSYRSVMHRILYRPWRTNPGTGLLQFTATFYWQDAAWSSVCFSDRGELIRTTDNVATRILRWPEIEEMK
jgi:hypothetical protein